MKMNGPDQKLSSETKDETRYSSAPIAQMRLLYAVFHIQGNYFCLQVALAEHQRRDMDFKSVTVVNDVNVV